MSDARPQITAHFVEPDEHAIPLLLAIGRAVWGVAGLEKTLQLELVRILVERDIAGGNGPSQNLGEKLSQLESLTAGQLLKELRELNLSPDLDERIGDAIERRNQLVHHMMEDPEVVNAVICGEGMDVVVKRFEQLALDCAKLAIELQVVATAKLEATLGKSQMELVELVQSVDPSTIKDLRERKQLVAVQVAGNLELPLILPE